MSKVRVAVEWEFGEVKKNFRLCKNKDQMKVLENNPGRKYFLLTALKNMMYCARGRSKTGDYFGVKPPVLEDYVLSLVREKIEGEDITVELVEVDQKYKK